MLKILTLIWICVICQSSKASNYMEGDLGTVSNWNHIASRYMWMENHVFTRQDTWGNYDLSYYNNTVVSGVVYQTELIVNFEAFETSISGTNIYWTPEIYEDHIASLAYFLYKSDSFAIGTNLVDYYDETSEPTPVGDLYLYNEELFDVYTLNTSTSSVAYEVTRPYLVVDTKLNKDIVYGVFNLGYSNQFQIAKQITFSNYSLDGYFANFQTSEDCQYILITTNISAVQIEYASDSFNVQKIESQYGGFVTTNISITSQTNIISFDKKSIPYKIKSLSADLINSNFTGSVYFGYYTNYNQDVVLDLNSETYYIYRGAYFYQPNHLITYKNIKNVFSNACTMTDTAYLPSSMNLVVSNCLFGASVTGAYPSELNAAKLITLYNIAATNISYDTGNPDNYYVITSSIDYGSETNFLINLNYYKPLGVNIDYDNTSNIVYQYLSDSHFVNSNYGSTISINTNFTYYNFINPSSVESNIYLESTVVLSVDQFLNSSTNVSIAINTIDTIPEDWKAWVLNNFTTNYYIGCVQQDVYEYFERVDN